jgi:hypothetical protein
MTRTNKQILEALSLAEGDNFTTCGQSLGIDTHEVLEHLSRCNDIGLILGALQIAFALGQKQIASLQARHTENVAGWKIKYNISRFDQPD